MEASTAARPWACCPKCSNSTALLAAGVRSWYDCCRCRSCQPPALLPLLPSASCHFPWPKESVYAPLHPPYQWHQIAPRKEKQETPRREVPPGPQAPVQGRSGVFLMQQTVASRTCSARRRLGVRAQDYIPPSCHKTTCASSAAAAAVGSGFPAGWLQTAPLTRGRLGQGRPQWQ